MHAKKEGAKEQPEWFEEAKVFCNGEEVMTVGGTQAEYVVDIWSGNHPFFQGRSSAIMTDAGQVSRFANRFGGRNHGFAGEEGVNGAERTRAVAFIICCDLRLTFLGINYFIRRL